MSAEEKINSLLLHWQERQDQGKDLSAEQLCRDCPELEAELRQQIAILRHMKGMLGTPEASAAQTMDLTQPEMVEPSEAEVSREGPEATGVYLPTQPQQTADSAAFRSDGGAAQEPALRQTSQVPGYETVKELGRGGMGVVYLARQSRLGRLVALKMVLAGGHARSDELNRFRTEAEAVARLQHPHIVQVFEVGDHEGLPFFSLEFCPGGSLDRKLAGSPLPPLEAAKLVETLARAMQAAHQANVIHRDLKPANVLLAADGTPKITDFGLAKKLDEAGQTQTGSVMGTPSYMAPEQAEGKKMVGPAADIYALGAILYECLTGRPPFKADTVYDTVLQVIRQEPVPPRLLNAKVPRDLETICLKCLQKSPGRRYTSAGELAEDLERYRAGEPIQARPVGRLERAWRWCRRNRGVALSLAGVAATLVLGAVVAGYFAIQASHNEKRAVQSAGEAVAREREARQALADLEVEKRQTTDLLYATRINLAHREWQSANALRARQLLYDCPQALRGWEWGYLKGLFDERSLALAGHSGAVQGVALTPDGSRAVTIGRDGTLRIWDARTGASLHQVKAQATRLAVSPDGGRVAVAVERSVKVFDVASGREVYAVNLADAPCGVGFVRNGAELAVAVANGEVRFLDADTGAERSRLPRRLSFAMATRSLLDMGQGVVFSPDGRRLAQGGTEVQGQLHVWDAATGEPILKETAHPILVGQVAFSPDGRLLASPGDEGDIRIWDLESKQAVQRLTGHRNFVNAVAFSPDGSRLLSGGADFTVRIWDLNTGECVQTLAGHVADVLTVAFADGGTAASAGLDGIARVWDVKDRVVYDEAVRKSFAEQKLVDPARRNSQESLTLRGYLGPAAGLVFSPDGKTLATAGRLTPTMHANPQVAREVVIWDLVGRRPVHRLSVPEERAHHLAFSPDGRQLAVGTDTGKKGEPATLDVFDAATGDLVWHREGPAGKLEPVFAPRGARLAASVANMAGANFLIAWEAADGKEVFRQPLTGPHTRATYSPDGQELLTAGAGNGAIVVEKFDAQTGQPRSSWPIGWKPGTAAFSTAVCGPNGLVAAPTVGERSAIKLFRCADGKEVGSLEGHVGSVASVAFSPDGRRLVSAGSDFTVRLWDTGSARELLTFREHTGRVSAVAWSPDGRRIGSAGQDMMVKVWDAPAGDAPPRTDNWRVVFHDAFAADGHAVGWKSVDGSWVVRGGSLRGRQVQKTYVGVTFPVAQAACEGVQLPRTVEVRFAYRADKPLVLGVSFLNAQPLAIYTALLCGGPIPFGSPCTKLQQLTEGMTVPSYLGAEQPFVMPLGRWQNVRVLRQPERIRVFVDDVEMLSERIPGVELPTLVLGGMWGAVGDEIEFKDVEVRIPASRPER